MYVCVCPPSQSHIRLPADLIRLFLSSVWTWTWVTSDLRPPHCCVCVCVCVCHRWCLHLIKQLTVCERSAYKYLLWPLTPSPLSCVLSEAASVYCRVSSSWESLRQSDGRATAGGNVCPDAAGSVAVEELYVQTTTDGQSHDDSTQQESVSSTIFRSQHYLQ